MIALITYDIPHRKTQDLVANLKMNGYNDLHLVVIPFVERKGFQPIFKHRPSKAVNVSIDQFCENMKLTFTRVAVEEITTYLEGQNFKHIMIAGAGLLPEDLAKKFKIINSHPGYLPNTKGLDAFKWAIFHSQPIGVTTHFISEEADEGISIERRTVPVYFEDSFHNVAYRIYETEIEMMVNAVRLIDNAEIENVLLSDKQYVANRRMPHNYEIIMMQRFEEMRLKSPSHKSLD